MKTNPLREAREILANAPLPPNAAAVKRDVDESMREALKNFKAGEISLRTLSQITNACEAQLKALRWPLTA